MEISCIIPTCDREELLWKSVDSVLGQSRSPKEIIIVNNGARELEPPPEVRGRVQIYNALPYFGVAQARNFGAILACGDYLAFLDDDDLWNVDYLKNVAKTIASGAKCIISRLDCLAEGKISKHKNAHEILSLENILTFNPGITGSNVVLARDVFWQVGGYDPKLPPSEDKSLILEVLRRKFPVETLPDNQVIRRTHHRGRLTDAGHMAEGIAQFLKKYGGLMSREQRLINLWKIYHYQYHSGSTWALFPLIVCAMLVKISKFFSS